MVLKNLKIIQKSFILNKSSINKILNDTNTDLASYNWDSMTIINLLTILSDNYNINIEPQVLLKKKTFKELDNFLTKEIKKKK